MKKIISWFVLLLTVCGLNAQINLVDGLSRHYNIEADNLNGENVTVMIDLDEIKIFDKQFNLKKDIHIPEELGYIGSFKYMDETQSSFKLKTFTTDFFNEDDLMEFIVLSESGLLDGCGLSIVNEEGQVLWQKKWDNHYVYWFMDYHREMYVYLKKDMDGNKFMIIHLYGYDYTNSKTEVYSVTGNLSSLSINKIQEISNPYPNPAVSSINLPYDLNGKKEGTIKIFDTEGKELQTVAISGNGDSFQLDTTSMPSGHYFYVVETAGSVVEKNRFLVK
ncbi:MAG: T9SS type A sorting domain-containing protein [Candidatus Azobacteroides sp.]|nr:T9SS type A sorting domain-containing protein [Candidatus Azobacteroides sp.]